MHQDPEDWVFFFFPTIPQATVQEQLSGGKSDCRRRQKLWLVTTHRVADLPAWPGAEW